MQSRVRTQPLLVPASPNRRAKVDGPPPPPLHQSRVWPRESCLASFLFPPFHQPAQPFLQPHARFKAKHATRLAHVSQSARYWVDLTFWSVFRFLIRIHHPQQGIG